MLECLAAFVTGIGLFAGVYTQMRYQLMLSSKCPKVQKKIWFQRSEKMNHLTKKKQFSLSVEIIQIIQFK